MAAALLAGTHHGQPPSFILNIANWATLAPLISIPANSILAFANFLRTRLSSSNKSTAVLQPDLTSDPSSFQSHTVDKNFTMSTGFFCFISSIQGCSSMRQGVARREGSFSKLRDKSASGHT